jgi:hypothetical protein
VSAASAGATEAAKDRPGAPQAPEHRVVLDRSSPHGQAALRSRPLRLAHHFQADDRLELRQLAFEPLQVARRACLRSDCC